MARQDRGLRQEVEASCASQPRLSLERPAAREVFELRRASEISEPPDFHGDWFLGRASVVRSTSRSEGPSGRSPARLRSCRAGSAGTERRTVAIRSGRPSRLDRWTAVGVRVRRLTGRCSSLLVPRAARVSCQVRRDLVCACACEARSGGSWWTHASPRDRPDWVLGCRTRAPDPIRSLASGVPGRPCAGRP
jgi:hypothetical protein